LFLNLSTGVHNAMNNANNLGNLLLSMNSTGEIDVEKWKRVVEENRIKVATAEFDCPRCGKSADDPQRNSIFCEGDCAKWFHFDCVGLKRSPPEDQEWECARCKGKGKARSARKKVPPIKKKEPSLPFDDYKELQTLWSCGGREAIENAGLAAWAPEVRDAQRHFERGAECLVVKRCKMDGCRWCGGPPYRQPELEEFLAPLGGTLPVPDPLDEKREHYKSLLQVLESGKLPPLRDSNHPMLQQQDENGRPRMEPLATGRCTEPNCSYTWSNRTDKKRHATFHRIMGKVPKKGPAPQVVPSFLMLLCDGGSDESPSKISFMFLLGRLFRLFDLDILCAITYCPGDSKLNPIERLWAIVTGLFGADDLPEATSAALIELRSWLDGESAGEDHIVHCAISDPDFSAVAPAGPLDDAAEDE